MNLRKRFFLPDFIASGIIVLYLVIGLFIVPDYGVTWDDSLQRTNGENNWEYITGKSKTKLIESIDKYHGPVMEIVFIAIEKGFHITDGHSIYVSRHMATFILFVISVAIFFLLCRRLFGSPFIALLAMLMMMLAPRIFGEGFYNPKDIPFLSAMLIAMYSLLAFVERPTWGHTLLHAFVCAFALDIRLIGIIYIPATLLISALCIYQGKAQIKTFGIKLLLFIGLWFGLAICMWPILFQGPFTELWSAYKQLSHYSYYNGLNLYAGQCIPSMELPWHYHWVWILVSLPEVYILLFVAGAAMLLFSLTRRGFFHHQRNVFVLLGLFIFLFPLVFRSIQHSTVLDGWRHVYFVYPFLVLVAVYAIDRLWTSRLRVIRYAALAVVSVCLIDNLVQIVSMHPLEFVYFNRSANNIFKPIDKNFEMDYWGLSYKQGFEYLLAHDTRPGKIYFRCQHYPGWQNFGCLPPAERARFEPVWNDEDPADYFLTSYRDNEHCPGSRPMPGELIYTIRAQGNKVMGVYKLR